MNPNLLAGILCGFWCKWRHGKQWENRGSRLWPYHRRIEVTHYCPVCDWEVTTFKRMPEPMVREIIGGQS